MRLALAYFAIVFSCSCTAAVQAAEKLDPGKVDFFERKIRPVLVENCYRCHSVKGKIEGGLRVDSRDSLREGGDSGSAVTPGDLDDSLLLAAIKYESYEMPPNRKLPDQVIKDFEHWIASGATDPRDDEFPTPEKLETSGIDFAKGKEFWSFQLPKSHSTPQHPWPQWPQTRIDQFVAGKMSENGLEPAPPASVQTLLRRLSFDLVGLPPSPTQVTTVLSQSQRDAIEPHLTGDRDELTSPSNESETQLAVAHYVDDLLSSDDFGEHWARMWLDLMRFADDQAHIVGNNTALCYPNAYLYRNWVIDAFNTDLPYDRFVQLQLAADILTPDDTHDDVALGFIGLGPKYYRRGAPEVMADEIEDRIDVLSRGLLGLTVACARCHDHKYDPIGAADYYALAGVFASIEMFNQPLSDTTEKDAKGQSKKPEDARHIVRDKNPKNVPILVRGDVNRPGPVVPRGFLQVLCAQSDRDRVQFENGSGRAELAEQIASADNPLTARVIVNRVWARLIGNPLVETQSNFGTLGERPTHPKLLDDLSVRFMENGWSLKWLCREIVMSATYQQTSRSHSTIGLDADPENRWLSRMNRKRLSVEQWRDAFLVASRQLNENNHDEHIDPSKPEPSRRTVYSDASRLRLNSMLSLFDYPDPNVHSAGRAQTTTASQKLFLMNSVFVIYHANELTRQLDSLPTFQAVEQAYLRLFGRHPSAEETQLAEQFLAKSPGAQNQSQLSSYLHGLMMTNEMLFLD